MEATNYLRTMLEMITRTKSTIPSHYALVIRKATAAPKFSLPFAGKLMDDDLVHLPEVIRLPYPVMVLEFPTHEYPLQPILNELPPENRSTDDDQGRDRVIVIAEQDGDTPIKLTMVHRVMGTDSWIWSPFTVKIANKRDFVSSPTKTGLWVHIDQHFQSAGEKPLGDVWLRKVMGAVYRIPMNAVYEVVEALTMRRLKTDEIPARKLNKSAKKRGALPFDTYKLLTLQTAVEEKPEPTLLEGESGTHRSPREHERMGHWRKCRSGKVVWINKSTINKGTGGKIVKDYQFK